MDWIERLFHVAPDGGNGSLELSIIIGVVIAILVVGVGVTKAMPIVRSACGRMTSRKQKSADAVLERVES